MLIHVLEHVVGDFHRVVVEVRVPADAHQIGDLLGIQIEVFKPGAKTNLDLQFLDGVGHGIHILKTDGSREFLHTAMLGVGVHTGEPVQCQASGFTVRKVVELGQREGAVVR